MAGAWNASDALIRLLRSTTQVGCGDASHTYTGTWTDVSDTGYMGGAAKKTTVAGSKVTITVTDKDAVDLVLIAYDDTALGAAGSAFTVKVDGVVRATQQTIALNNATTRGGSGSTFTVKGTTSNQHNNSGAYKNYKYCQMVISLTGIGSGTHTIEIAPTIASSEFVYNGYLIPAPVPPWILNAAFWQFPDSMYTSSLGFATAAVGKQTADWFNQIAAQVTAQFTDGRVIFFDPMAWGSRDPVTQGATPAGWQGWDTSVHVSSGDSLHQSDLGHGFYAAKILRALNERIPAPYTTPSAPTQLAPTGLGTFDLIGTRDYTVIAGSNTFAIECEGPGGGGGGGSSLGTGRGGGGGAYAKKNTTTYTVGSVLTQTVSPGAAGGVQNGAGATGIPTQVVLQVRSRLPCRDGPMQGGRWWWRWDRRGRSRHRWSYSQLYR